ncbi:hypothetical protein L218DRAFT_958979 [Marasmius fiardii PR-910]|nr:hypothetical protein L218DRAFT_958979 [Marasmius fiardii PR-910]
MCEDRLKVLSRLSKARFLRAPSSGANEAIQSPSLSPILAIPPEILSLVFNFTVENNCFGQIKGSCRQVGASLLTGVCSKWRDVAMNTPEIWARIWIQHDLSVDRITVEEQERLKKYLGRAKSFPLSVEIILKDTLLVGASASTRMERFTLLKVLTESSGWATLTLRLRHLLQDVCRSILGKLRENLESLRRLEIYIEASRDISELQLWQGETKFPNLHTLHLHHETYELTTPTLGIDGTIDAIIFPYSQLNHLSLDLNRNHEETLQVLQSCQKHLRSLQINLFSTEDNMTFNSVPPLNFISLQTLTIDSLSSCSRFRLFSPNILNAMRTPSLESLTLSHYITCQEALFSLSQTLVSLLERSGVSGSLRELRFSNHATSRISYPGPLLDLLDITTGLENFQLRVSGGMENVNDRYGPLGALRRLTGTPLLPRLKHLHILYENLSPAQHAWSKEFETMVEWRSANGPQSVLLEIIVRPDNKSFTGLNLERLKRLQKEQGLAIRVVNVWNGKVHGELFGYTVGAQTVTLQCQTER